MDNLEKSIQQLQDIYKGYYKLEGRYFFRGIPISVENRRGTPRFHKNSDTDSIKWRTTMRHDYGYIRGTTTKADGDALDVFVKPNFYESAVFIVHQRDPDTGKYDEDKVFLGFSDRDEVKKEYLLHYDRPGFLGPITEMDIKTFKEIVLGKNRKNLPKLSKLVR